MNISSPSSTNMTYTPSSLGSSDRPRSPPEQQTMSNIPTSSPSSTSLSNVAKQSVTNSGRLTTGGGQPNNGGSEDNNNGGSVDNGNGTISKPKRWSGSKKYMMSGSNDSKDHARAIHTASSTVLLPSSSPTSTGQPSVASVDVDMLSPPRALTVVTSASSNDKKLSLADFDVIKVLGEGAFAQVMMVRKKDDDQIYAMKVSALI
jgi:hypothetical protein